LLHKTVEELLATTSATELIEWQAYFKIKNEREEERAKRRKLEEGAVKGAADMTRKLRAKR
jgi:hypothetical protein